mgnify:FL=1|jgi:hypothetical protein
MIFRWAIIQNFQISATYHNHTDNKQYAENIKLESPEPANQISEHHSHTMHTNSVSIWKHDDSSDRHEHVHTTSKKFV